MVQVVKDTLFTTYRANEPSRANGSGNKFEFPLRPPLDGMPVCEDTDLLDEQHLEKWDARVDNEKEFVL